MPGVQVGGSSKPYLHIVAGNLAQKVDKDTVGARKRDWELANGTKGTTYELNFMNWTGVIQDIRFKEGEAAKFGDDCVIELEDAFINLKVDSRYFADFAQKVMSGNLKEPFLFHPYDIEVDGKKRRGISLQQNGVKLQNYFYDYEAKKALHGFPEVDEEKRSKMGDKYWKVYFAETSVFLIDILKNLHFEKPETKEDPLESMESSLEDNLDDLPF